MVILCCILWFCTSCTFDFDEPGVCPYNVRLNYRYAGRPDAGQLSMYVDNIHQFLFDADGVLKDIRLLKGDSLEYWQGELAPGRYTLVAWGNWGYESDVVPAPQPGVTQIRELAMTSATGTPTGTSTSEYRSNTERLYYGYSTFEIPATGNSVNRTVLPDPLPRPSSGLPYIGKTDTIRRKEQEDIHSACGACLANTAFRQVTTYRWPVVTELSHFPP